MNGHANIFYRQSSGQMNGHTNLGFREEPQQVNGYVIPGPGSSMAETRKKKKGKSMFEKVFIE